MGLSNINQCPKVLDASGRYALNSIERVTGRDGNIMRFQYPAELWHAGPNEVVVSFRDIQGCHTSGEDETKALEEAQDALEEAIAGRINRGEDIPMPSVPLPDERLVSVPTDMAAKAAFVLAFRSSGMT